MGFQQGLSGLNSATKDLDVIGNNVANSTTVGFKGSEAQFADVYANSLSGAGAGQVGIGSKLAAVAQMFSQGTITATNNPLDIAINGKGFFRMDNNGAITYARNGQFQFDKDGYIVNSERLRLTGYGVDANGNILTASPAPIQISFADIAPNATTDFNLSANLDSREVPPVVAIFNPSDPTSYTASTSGTVFDTLGNSHVFTAFFVKTATSGQWNVHATVDGTALANVNLGAGAGLPTTINFNSSGRLTTAMPVSTSLTIGTGAVTPLAFTFDLTGTTQYGASFGVNNLTQDGFTSGRLAGFNVSDTGIIVGRYTNGIARNLGQVVLADFRNAQGLKPLGGNQWEETSESGLPLVGAPNSGPLGVLQSAAVEDSNVDLTEELVSMITAQRVYQANAQTIKTQDQVLQTLVNLR